MAKSTKAIREAGKNCRALAAEWQKTTSRGTPYGDPKKLMNFINFFRKAKQEIGLSFNKANLESQHNQLVEAKEYFIKQKILKEENTSKGYKNISLQTKKPSMV